MFAHLRSLPQWRKNLYVLSLGACFTGLGFSLILPFLSLYVASLGHFSKMELSLWSGAVFSASYIVQALTSPFWGALADRKGRKLMALRTSLGMAVVISLMGCVTAVWQLLILRLLQGFFSGYVSNGIAMIAAETPHEHSGEALGTINSGLIAGQLSGPLLGGIIAQVWGYHVSFFLTGILLFAAFLLSLFFVHETFKPVITKKADQPSTAELYRAMSPAKRHLILIMIISTMILNLANFAVTPVLSLYVKQLMHNSGAFTLVSGVIAAMPGLAMFFTASRLGHLGDRIGALKILKAALVLALVLNCLMFFSTQLWQLGVLRFILGIANAALLPSVQTVLAKNTDQSIAGRVFAYNQSFQAAGMFSGPLLGSALAGAFTFNSVFVAVALIICANIALVVPLKRSVVE